MTIVAQLLKNTRQSICLFSPRDPFREPQFCEPADFLDPLQSASNQTTVSAQTFVPKMNFSMNGRMNIGKWRRNGMYVHTSPTPGADPEIE